MVNLDLKTSTISQELTYNLMEHYNFAWAANRTPGLYRTVFFTIAEILKSCKSKSTPKVGFMLKDTNGEFKFGAILIYHAPEEGEEADDDKGNFTLEFTLKAEDMEDLDKVVDNHSDLFVECSGRKATQIMYGRFLNMEYCDNLFNEAIDTLIKFLDANASEEEEVELVYQGVFTANVLIENGEKIITITPGEMIKQFIKGDASL